MNLSALPCGQLSERIQEPLHIIVIAKEVEHHHVFLGLREDHTALPAQPQLENPTRMNLSHAQPSTAMGLAERARKFLHGVRQLSTEILRSTFKLALKATRERDSHARRRDLVTAEANAAGDSCTLATPASSSARASRAR